MEVPWMSVMGEKGRARALLTTPRRAAMLDTREPRHLTHSKRPFFAQPLGRHHGYVLHKAAAGPKPRPMQRTVPLTVAHFYRSSAKRSNASVAPASMPAPNGRRGPRPRGAARGWSSWSCRVALRASLWKANSAPHHWFVEAFGAIVFFRRHKFVIDALNTARAVLHLHYVAPGAAGRRRPFRARR